MRATFRSAPSGGNNREGDIGQKSVTSSYHHCAATGFVGGERFHSIIQI